jgi:hypothetical protein
LRGLCLAIGSLCIAATLAVAQSDAPRADGKTSAQSRPTSVAGSSQAADLARWKRADETVLPQLNYAFSLGDRGAVYSSNARFVDCLRTVARVLDAGQPIPRHEQAQALFMGLTALRESDDFVQATPATSVNISRLIVVHKTPILKGSDVSKMSPQEALRRYYCFSQRQLVLAVEKVPAASRALYGLGRIEAYRSSRDGLTTAAGSAKALLLHQAALIVDANNFAAANEIGVLLARAGNLKGAKTMFKHSVSVHPEPATWHNLAEVYGRLGDDKSADLARRNSESLTKAHQLGDDSPDADEVQTAMVRWVDNEEFVSNGVAADCTYDLRRGPAAAPGASTKAPQSKKQSTEAKRSDSRMGRAWSSLREKMGSPFHRGQTKHAVETRDSQDSVNR